jgi:hypothetical protein
MFSPLNSSNRDSFLTKRAEKFSRTVIAFHQRVYSASSRNEYQKQKNNVSGEQSAAGA